MEIVGGTYDKLLFGLRYGDDGTLAQTFAYAPHGGCIKALALRGKLLVSGSTDESIKIYDLRKRKEVGTLMQHNGPVTCLEFVGRTHLMSGSEDKSICIWSTSDWDFVHALKGHKSTVNSIVAHLSGKLALSSSKDMTVKLWDLVKGKSAYTQEVQTEVDVVKWSPDGDKYALLQGSEIRILSAKDKKVVCSFKHGKRVNCFDFIDDDTIVSGGEERVVCKWSLRSAKLELSSPEPHQNRIRGLAVLPGIGPEKANLIVSGSSDGEVAFASLDTLARVKSTSTNQRITCLVAGPTPSGAPVSAAAATGKKRKAAS